MKIDKFIKDNLIDEDYELTEADNNSDTTVDEINPQKDSVAEVADAIKNTVEQDSDGEATLSDAKADSLAQQAVQTADEINANDMAIIDKHFATSNILTRKLDTCLADSKIAARRGDKANNNLLVEGLPGSGKTAIVYDWASRNNVNICYVNMKNHDLDAFLNGYPVQDKDDYSTIIQAYSAQGALADLELPNSVLFLDEYNRQKDEAIRASVLTLINEKYVGGKEKGMRHYFKNLLFTIACINPAIPTDPGAAQLIQAERTRFSRQLVGKNAFDSRVDVALDYFHKHFSKVIVELAKKTADKTDPIYLEDLEDYLREENLGVFIVSQPDFYFDAAGSSWELDAKLNRLSELEDSKAALLNLRLLTDGLYASHGNVKAMIDWVQEDSNLFSRESVKDQYGITVEGSDANNTEKMLLTILRRYTTPTFEELVTDKQAELDSLGLKVKLLDDASQANLAAKSNANSSAKDANAASTSAAAPETEIADDDDDFFIQNTNTGKTAVGASEAEQKINDFFNNLSL